MNHDKNYPRYPVDLYKISLIFLETSEEIFELPEIQRRNIRENPFGTAFTVRAD